MQRIDEWQIPDDGGFPTQPAIARKLARVIFACLEQFTPKPALVELFCDVGLPWMQVCYDHTVRPTVVLEIGNAIKAAFKHGRYRHAVLFQALRPRSIYFVVDGDFLRVKGDAQLDADTYGVPLDDLKVWSRGSETGARR